MRSVVLFLVLVLMLFVGAQRQAQLALNRFLVKYVLCVADDYAENNQACTESKIAWDGFAHLLQDATQTNVAFWSGNYAPCHQTNEARAVARWQPIAREVVFRIFALVASFECGEVDRIALARKLDASASTVDYFVAHQLLSAGSPEQAAAYYERALAKYDVDERVPGKDERFWALARYYIDRKTWEQAILLLGSGLFVCRDCWLGRCLLGKSYLPSGETSEAIIYHLKEAQRLNPRWGEMYRIVLEELIAAQRYAAAKAIAQ